MIKTELRVTSEINFKITSCFLTREFLGHWVPVEVLRLLHDLLLQLNFLRRDVKEDAVVVQEVLAHVRFAGCLGKVEGGEAVHGEEGGAPDGGKVVGRHQVLVVLVPDRAQVADETA